MAIKDPFALNYPTFSKTSTPSNIPSYSPAPAVVNNTISKLDVSKLPIQTPPVVSPKSSYTAPGTSTITPASSIASPVAAPAGIVAKPEMSTAPDSMYIDSQGKLQIKGTGEQATAPTSPVNVNTSGAAKNELTTNQSTLQQQIDKYNADAAAATVANNAELDRRAKEQESAIRNQWAPKQEALNQQLAEGMKSSEALQFKLGRAGTNYASEEQRKLQVLNDQRKTDLANQIESYVQASKEAIENKKYSRARELQADANTKFSQLMQIQQNEREEKAADLDRVKTGSTLQIQQHEAAMKQLDEIAITGGGMSDADLAQFDAALGNGQGFAKSYIDVKQSLASAKTQADAFENQSKVIDMLAKVPADRTISVPGFGTMTGLKEVDFMKGVFRTTEKDDTGNVTEVLTRYNPETGKSEVLSMNNLGQIGSGKTGTTTAGGGSTAEVASGKREATPEELNTAMNALSSIRELETHPGIEGAVGMFGTTRSKISGTKENDFATLLNKFVGSETLKNMGMIKGVLSDKDMEVLRQASTALNQTNTPEQFKKELLKLKVAADGATGYQNVTANDYITAFPDRRQGIIDIANELEAKYGKEGYDDQDVLKAFNRKQLQPSAFSNVGSDTNSATLQKLNNKEVGTVGGQCGRFVNQLTGLGLGDSYENKISKMDPSITYPEPGMVFVTPYKDTGHTGFILGVEGDQAIVKDSNYRLDEKVATHKIPLNKITGLRRV